MKPLSPWGGTVPPHVEAVERLQGTAVLSADRKPAPAATGSD